VTRQAVDKIVKRRPKIEREMSTRRLLNLPTDTYTRRTLTSKYPTSEVDIAVHKWLVMMADNGRDIDVTGDISASKAMEFAEVMGVVNFKASSGWVTKLKKTVCTSIISYQIAHSNDKCVHSFNIASIIRCGESGAVEHTAESLSTMRSIRDLMETFTLDTIWNLDETALYHRTLSARTYVPRSVLQTSKIGAKRASSRRRSA